MYRKLVISLCLVLFSAAIGVAQEHGASSSDAVNASYESDASNGSNAPNEANASNGSGESDAKTLRGMSVLGNDEAPMSLFIVPWKSSQLGVETNLTRTLNERVVPVDRDVFLRELDFYKVSVGNRTSAPAVVSQVFTLR